MNLLGMGTMEIVVILVVALMIFGPGKLPEMAGQAGRMLRDFKKMTTDLSDEFEKSSGIGDIKKQVEREMAGIQKEVGGVTTGVKKELTSATNTVNKATGKKPAASTKSLPSKPANSASKSTTSNGLKTTTTSGGTKVTSAAKSSNGSSGTKSTAASKTAKPVKVEPPKATKADPLADVSFMDDILDDAASEKPAAATAAPTPVVTDNSDALARARARRQQAGYARVQA